MQVKIVRHGHFTMYNPKGHQPWQIHVSPFTSGSRVRYWAERLESQKSFKIYLPVIRIDWEEGLSCRHEDLGSNSRTHITNKKQKPGPAWCTSQSQEWGGRDRQSLGHAGKPSLLGEVQVCERPISKHKLDSAWSMVSSAGLWLSCSHTCAHLHTHKQKITQHSEWWDICLIVETYFCCMRVAGWMVSTHQYKCLQRPRHQTLPEVEL